MQTLTEYLDTIPQGRLGIIAMKGCEELAQRVSDQIVECRAKFESENDSNLHLKGYHRDSYILSATFPRFSTGEGKAVINESIRGYDLFIISDCFNYSVKYKMYDLKDANGDPLMITLQISRELFQPAQARQRESQLLCLCFMKADSIEDQHVNLLTVHLHFRNLKIWVSATLSLSTHTIPEFRTLSESASKAFPPLIR